MQELENRFTFPKELVDDAIAVPNGHFVEIDDMLYEANGLSRKILQTQLVKIDGKEVSVGSIGGVGSETATHELVIGSENPIDIGSFESITADNKDLFTALHQLFGGVVSSYQPIEMVIAIRAAVTEGVSPANTNELAKIAASARAQTKRGAWIAHNHMQAFTKAPIDWPSVGL